MVKLNLGSGKEIKEGFDGVDIRDFGQKYIHDIRNGLTVLATGAHDSERLGDESVDEVYTRYFLPILTKQERMSFFNELYRILKPNAIATIIIPNWNSAGGYGHPDFKDPIYEGFFYFLSKKWREENAPDVDDLTCNFEVTWGYNMHPNLLVRNQEYQQFAISNYCNAGVDIIATAKKVVL